VNSCEIQPRRFWQKGRGKDGFVVGELIHDGGFGGDAAHVSEAIGAELVGVEDEDVGFFHGVVFSSLTL
jgi:hypothetical protein